MKIFVPTMAVLIGLLAVSPAKADGFFDGLTGLWQGRGFVRTDPKSPEENIRCRLKLGETNPKDSVDVRGSCSIAGFMLPINGSIRASGGGYSSNLFTNLVQITTRSFTGRRRGTSLTMDYDGFDTVSKEDIRAKMTIKRQRHGFDISLQRTAPNSSRFFNIGTISFKSR